jgi:ADP-ribose pyrophosphatase YjhB (NUDIX family)
MAKRNLNFILQPGQTDYTNIRWAPVINCVVMCKDKMLLVQRNENMNFYPGYWNGISGFLDDGKSLQDKVKEELREELGISAENIASIKLGEIFDQEEPKYKKTWIVHPVLVKVKTNAVSLDWEARKFEWVTISKARKMKLLPGFSTVLDKVLALKQR